MRYHNIRRNHLHIFFIAWITFLLLYLTLTYCYAEDNLLINGNFSETDNNGLPVGWHTEAYIQDAGYTSFSVQNEQPDESGSKIICINNFTENDARFVQTVDVNPDSLYCFSGFIKAENIESGRGANLSVEGLYAFSESVYDTEGDWQYVEWYGETGENQYSVTLFARVGGYSGTSKGKAWFSDLELFEVDELPEDSIADQWYKPDESDEYFDEEDEEDTSGSAARTILFITVIIYCFIFFISMQKCGSHLCQRDLTEKKAKLYLIFGLLFSFVLRITISAYIAGYSVDVNCFLSWGNTMLFSGPKAFYSQTSFCDYPPLYMYILGLNSAVLKLIPAANASASNIVFRFLPSLCDVVSCYILYVFASGYKSHDDTNSNKKASLFCFILSLNPVSILNSAAWGQMDSVLCLMILLVAVFAIKDKWQFALPCYILSVLTKPQALMLGIIGLVSTVIIYIKKNDSRKKILIGLIISFIAAVAVILPFSIGQKPGWLIQKYSDTLSSYPYATVNTANIYYLLGGNWNSVTNKANFLAPIIMSVLCIGYGIWWNYRTRQNRTKITAENILIVLFILWFIFCALTEQSWALTGIAAMVFAFLIILSLYIRKSSIHLLPYLGALLFILLYVFGVKMHERYLIPAFLLLAFSYTILKDFRVLYILIGFSVTVFLNEGIVLDNSIRLGSSMGHLNPDTVVIADIISLINIICSIYAVYLGIEFTAEDYHTAACPKIVTLLRLKLGKTDNINNCLFTDRKLYWSLKDSICLGAVTLIYSIVCLTTLGSTKAPQTVWTSSDYNESVIFELDSAYDDFSMLYFAQVSRNDFSVSVSSDCIKWSEEYWAQMNQGECWKWKYLTESWEDDEERRYTSGTADSILRMNGKYVRITSEQIGLSLCEVIFRDRNDNIIPIINIEHINGNPESELYTDPVKLIDEQNTFEGLPDWFNTKEITENAQPSWWNSTYFDEIYHARTGYEFLHAAVPYETSHPPMGKILISCGIALFGMTPFGWRFAGALAGIMMLPAMYLLGKQLTKKTSLAFIASLLMALDCMHLTQSQIATIDSFPVLFIIISYLFMLRFVQTDLNKDNTKGILLNLAICGIFMGLSVASKWIGVYAGIGLAILFFWHCYRNIKATDVEHKTKVKKKIISLCLWCVLFFVLIPVIIYLLSYIPYFAYSTKIKSIRDYLISVWDAQIGMLNYHSTPGLGMDHPFYSPWYQWPVIGKPMYYASKSYLTNRDYSYSIFCFGNPAIWYISLLTLPVCLFFGILRKTNIISGCSINENRICINRDISGILFMITGFLAQFLPWVLVPRGTYIYHYFASTPFLMLSIILGLSFLLKQHRKLTTALIVIYLLFVFASFVIFFPYASGIYSPVSWLEPGKHILKIWY